MRPKLINKAIKYNDYDGKQKLKNEPRTGAQDCGTPRTGEQTGEPLLCGQGNIEFRGSGNLSRYCQKHPLQDDPLEPTAVLQAVRKTHLFEKKKLIEWVRGAKSMSVEEIKEEAAAKIMEMNERQ